MSRLRIAAPRLAARRFGKLRLLRAGGADIVVRRRWDAQRCIRDKIPFEIPRRTYKGHHGAELQMGMTVMASNAATLVRIGQNRLSKRAQKLRRLLGLKRHNMNEFNVALN
jgi:hypothetical protein